MVFQSPIQPALPSLPMSHPGLSAITLLLFAVPYSTVSLWGSMRQRS